MSNSLASTGVIEVNGKEFAVGLFWQTAENPDSGAKEAREAALQETDPPENYCVRKGHVTQWGLGGWRGSGHKAGMPTAAPILAEELTGNWLGVFKTNAGWWFVSARRDAILPDGDVLYDNEEEPRDRFEMEFGRGGWDRVFTPAEWAIGGDTTELDDLIGATVANEVKLQSVAGMLGPITKSIANPAHRQYWLGAVAVALVGFVGYVGASVLDFEGPGAGPTPTPIPTPTPLSERQPRDRSWEAKPLPSEWAQLCTKTLAQIYFEIPGWQVDTFSCAPESATATYMRAGSTIEDAAAAILARNTQVSRALNTNASTPIFSRFGGEGNIVNLTLQYSVIGSPEPRGKQVLMDRELIEATVWQRFQEIAMPVSMQFYKAGPQPAPNDRTVPCTSPQPAQVSFTAPVDPEGIAGLFDTINGSFIESADFDLATKEWEYTVRIEEATINDDSYAEYDAEKNEDILSPEQYVEHGPPQCQVF